jgi:hypothetical protein
MLIFKSNNPNPNENPNQELHKNVLCSSCISIYHCVSFSRNQHKKRLEKVFKYTTKKSLDSFSKFMYQKSIVNDTRWIMAHLKRDLPKEWKDKYVKTLQVWKEIEYEAKENGLVPIFFTGTVQGHLHPFSTFGKNQNNRKADWHIEKLNLAYQELQDLHIQIRKQANRTLGYSPTFIRAIEYHQTFVPHSHLVYFVKKEDEENFVKIIKNKSKLNENIGRTTTEVLNSYDPDKSYSPISYLLKYLKKNISEMTDANASLEQLEIFNGWKLKLGIKQLYNNSLYRIPKWATKKVSQHFKDFEKMGYRSMLEAIENNVHIVNESIQLDGTIKTKIVNKCENAEYQIYRKIERIQYVKKNPNHFDDDELFITNLGDRILEYVVRDKKGNVLFDKNEWQLMEDRELSQYQELTVLGYLRFHLSLEQIEFAFLLREFFVVQELLLKKKSELIFDEEYFIETAQHLEYDILPFGCIQEIS